tara:strand:- start:652 stop:1095 length:444 start_codon:yes stop_codon:yes gene_type:complete
MAAFGVLGGILFLIVGIIQIYVGYIGIEYHLGAGFAIGALFIGFFFRIMLPLTIGTFFGALDVWGWPWYAALAFAAPGLLFIVPALVTTAIGSLTTQKTSQSYREPDYNYYDERSDNLEEPKNITPKKNVTKKKKKTIAKKKKKISK